MLKGEEDCHPDGCKACWDREIRIKTKKEELTTNKFTLDNKIILENFTKNI